MIKNSEHEKKFLQELAALFAGAETKGDSGFVNLILSGAVCVFTRYPVKECA